MSLHHFGAGMCVTLEDDTLSLLREDRDLLLARANMLEGLIAEMVTVLYGSWTPSDQYLDMLLLRVNAALTK